MGINPPPSLFFWAKGGGKIYRHVTYSLAFEIRDGMLAIIIAAFRFTSPPQTRLLLLHGYDASLHLLD